MYRAFRSEWLKIRRLSVLAGGGAMIGLSALFAYFGIDRIVAQSQSGARRGPEGMTPETLATTDGLVRYLGRSSSLLEVIALIMIAGAVAAEYNQGTLRNLLVRQPERLTLLTGKMLAMVAFIGTSAVAAMAVAFGVSIVEANHVGISTAAWMSSGGVGQVLALDGDILLATLGFCLMGMFFAVVFRSAAAAIGVSLAYLLAVEGILTSLWNELSRWLPGSMFDTIATGNDQVTYGRAAVLASVYAVAMVIVTAVLFRRRDVTS